MARFRHHRAGWRFGGFFVGIVLLCAESLVAQESTKVAGIVKQVDAKTGTITIRPSRKGATEDEAFSLLKKDIDVTTPGGGKVLLSAVMPGHLVQLAIRPAGDVEAILIQPPVFSATVLDVDPKERTVAVARDGLPTKTMTVAPDARVSITGQSVFLREVKPGSQMTVTASLDGKVVLGLNLLSDPDGKLATKLYTRVKVSRLPGVRWAGTIADVDLAKNEMRFVGAKTKGVTKTLTIAKDAMVQLKYGEIPIQTITLKQVIKQVNATLMVAQETEQVTRVFVEPPVLRAKVKRLDGDGGQLTVSLDGAEKTFGLRRDIKVMEGTRVRRLKDLQPDLAVSLVLSLDREQLLAVDIR